MRNILIDRNKSLVNVIDWDWRYQEKGNPIYDFMWLVTNIMMLSNDPITEFRSNLNDNGKAVTAKRIIKETMKNHFQVNLDFSSEKDMIRKTRVAFKLQPFVT